MKKVVCAALIAAMMSITTFTAFAGQYDTQVYSCKIRCWVGYGKPKMSIRVKIRSAGGSKARTYAINNGTKYCKQAGGHHYEYVSYCDPVGW